MTSNLGHPFKLSQSHPEGCLPKFELYNKKMENLDYLKTQIQTLSTTQDLTKLYEQQGGMVGLNNLGNTCYFNAAIQCLRHTRHLNAYLMGDKAYLVLLKHIKKELINENKDQDHVAKLALTVTYIKTLGHLWSGESGIYHPISLKMSCDRTFPQFRGNDQHDSHEFVTTFLDSLHSSLSRRVNYKLIGQPITEFDIQIKKAQEDFSHYYQQQHSAILDTFCGQLQAKMVCLTCNRPSSRYDPFMCLDLSLPVNISKIPPVSYTIYECFQKYIEPENMDETNAYDCTYCQKKSEAYKVQSFWSLPNILMIKLSRFTHTFSQGQYQSHKIDEFIHYPLTSLDLSKYVTGPSTPKSLPIYNLYAVICHRGTVDAGHYYALAYNHVKGKWYCYDDNRVLEVHNHAQLITKDAYILFYEKSYLRMQN